MMASTAHPRVTFETRVALSAFLRYHLCTVCFEVMLLRRLPSAPPEQRHAGSSHFYL